jgi:probable rRNA maturation factor
LEINFFFSDKKFIRFDINNLVKRFEKIAFFEGYCIEIVNFNFVSDRTIVIQNKKYLNHNYPTDIITFDYSEQHIISGDIYISLDTILYNSKKFNVDFKNELYRVMIHGLLHLMKFDDKSATEKILMRKKENYYLRFFCYE